MTTRLRLTHEGDSKSNHRIVIRKKIRGILDNHVTKIDPGNETDVIVYRDLELIVTEERIIDKDTDFTKLE